MRNLARLAAPLGALIVALAAPGLALAGPVTLRAQPVDSDGQVTLGDLFEGAGAAAGIVVARRAGPTAVLEAGAVQAQAARAGLIWSNPQGLRRIVVRDAGGAAPAATPVATSAEASGRPAAASVAGRTAEVLTYARSLAAGEIVQPEDVAWTTVQAHQAQAGGPRDAEAVIGLSARRALRAGAPVSVRDLAAPQVIARNDTVQVAYEVGGVRLTVTGRAARNAGLGEPLTVINAASGRAIDAIATGPGQAIAGPAAQAARAQPQQFAAR